MLIILRKRLSQKICFLFLLMLPSISLTDLVSSNVIQVKCDFKLHTNGCEESVGSVCDQSLNRCVCKDNHTIRLSNGVCLLPKMIEEDCTTSAQCLVKNSACYATEPELKQWKCQCSPEFWLNVDQNNNTETNPIQSCEQRLSFGQMCQNKDQCSEELFCSQTEQRCVCEQDSHFDSTLNKCIHKNSKTCDENHEWSQRLNKCVKKVHYSHRGTSGGGDEPRARPNSTRDGGSKGWSNDKETKSSGHRIKFYANIYFYSISLVSIILLNNKQI